MQRSEHAFVRDTGSTFNAHRRRLLIVDDEPHIRASLQRLLRRDGYDIVTADGVDAALARLDTEIFDLLLVDQRMPGQLGTELCAIAAKHYPNTVRIVLSGYSDVNEVARSIAMGHVHEFLPKPWDDSGLRSHIRTALASRARLTVTSATEGDCVGRLVSRDWLEARLRQLSELGEQFGPQANTIAVVVFSVCQDGLFGLRSPDIILEQVESRFVRALTGTDALAQITPGLFAALTVRPGGVNAADKLFCRLLRSIADPVELDGAPLTLNLSGGAAFSTGDAEQIPKLLTQALDAHRWSAAARPNELLYFRDQRPGVESRPALQDDLKSAVARDQLSLYCMPEVSLVDGALAGLQALTRWVHPRYGMIDRSILTALRGDSELARTVLLWVLRELLATAATAQAAAPTLKRITLDAHATELADEHFADLVALACGEAGQSASILTLSIAATELDSLHEDALAQLIKVRDLGAHIAIAKFGVQSPSKKSLARIPFDTIVIDPLCLRASVTNGKARRALHSALARMENQSVRRIAYGIESLHELQAALTFGCQYLQGLICGRPIAAVQVGAFVRSIKPDGLSFLASNRQSLEGVA